LCLDKHSSGDGIIAALQVLHALRASNKTLAELSAEVTLYPQVLINVTVKQQIDLKKNAALQAAVKSAEAELNGSGRVLLRASGTEPKIRVMVEGRSREQVQKLAQRIAEAVREAAF